MLGIGAAQCGAQPADAVGLAHDVLKRRWTGSFRQRFGQGDRPEASQPLKFVPRLAVHDRSTALLRLEGIPKVQADDDGKKQLDPGHEPAEAHASLSLNMNM
jgi:hypothetical protein